MNAPDLCGFFLHENRIVQSLIQYTQLCTCDVSSIPEWGEKYVVSDNYLKHAVSIV